MHIIFTIIWSVNVAAFSMEYIFQFFPSSTKSLSITSMLHFQAPTLCYHSQQLLKPILLRFLVETSDQDIFVIIFIFVYRNKEVKIVSASAPGAIFFIRFKFLLLLNLFIIKCKIVYHQYWAWIIYMWICAKAFQTRSGWPAKDPIEA